MERTWYELVLIPLETAFYSEAKKKIFYIAHSDSKQKTGKSLGIDRESVILPGRQFTFFRHHFEEKQIVVQDTAKTEEHVQYPFA